MRSLREMTDAEFLRRATGGESADDFVEDRVLAALQELTPPRNPTPEPYPLTPPPSP